MRARRLRREEDSPHRVSRTRPASAAHLPSTHALLLQRAVKHPRTAQPDTLLQLQRLYSNRAVTSLVTDAIQRAPPRPSKRGRITPSASKAQVKFKRMYGKKFALEHLRVPGIMSRGEMEQRGGKGTGLFSRSQVYLDVLAQVQRYHEQKESDPFNFRQQLNTLQTLGQTAGKWWAKYKVWSKKGRRGAIGDLRKQIVMEQHKLNSVKATQARATRLGKGMPKVKFLAERAHLLEAYDPKHREASILIKLYQWWDRDFTRWPSEESPPPKAFFAQMLAWEKESWAWVDDLTDDALDPIFGIGKADTRVKFQKIKNEGIKEITYLGTDERAAFKLAFNGTQASYEQSRLPFTKGMYVMTPGGEFYGGQESVTQGGAGTKYYHHSSFLAGLPVGAAGKLEAGAKEMVIDPESGHYQPRVRHMINAVKVLNAKNVPMNKLRVKPFITQFFPYNFNPPADVFLRELRYLKSLPDLKAVEWQAVKVRAPWMSRVIRAKEAHPEAHAQLVDAAKWV